MNIDSSITDQLHCLSERCPVLCPSIFPAYYHPKSIENLCSTKEQENAILSHTQHHIQSATVCFPTTIHYDIGEIHITELKYCDELDAKLYSVEKVMGLLVIGSTEELTVLISRFLEVNGHEVPLDDGRRLFYEAYHVAYSLKILISNIAGIRVLFAGTHLLPFSKETSLAAVVKSIAKMSRPNSTAPSKVSIGVAEASDAMNIEQSEEIDTQATNNAKRRKKKRSKA